MWQVIAEGSSLDEFQASTTTKISDLPKGTRLLYHIEMLPGLGKLADLVGAEFLAQYFTPNGIIVDDVYGDWTWAEIRAHVDPPLAPLTAVAIIVVALSALGIAIILYISLKAFLPFLTGEWWGIPIWAWLLGGVASGFLVIYFLTRGPSPPTIIMMPPLERGK